MMTQTSFLIHACSNHYCIEILLTVFYRWPFFSSIFIANSDVFVVHSSVGKNKSRWFSSRPYIEVGQLVTGRHDSCGRMQEFFERQA